MAIIEVDGLLTIVLTLLLRCGYILIHISCIPTTNVNNIYMQYLFNMGASTLIYSADGSMLALGKDWKGIAGISWIPDCMEMVRGWSASMWCSSIVQLVTAGRIHMLGDILMTVLFSGVIQPLVYHCVWTRDGWINSTQYKSSTYTDITGGSVIHLFSGSFAFGALIIFGGRIINVNNLDHNSLAINAQSTSAMGYLLVMASTTGLMLQSPYILPQDLTTAEMNCIIGLATGLTVTTLFYFLGKKHGYWTVIWILQGGLSSLLILASGLGTYSRILSFLFSIVGVTAYLLISLAIRTSGLEDYCNLISVHLAQGLLGSYLPAFSGNEDNQRIAQRLLWQGICSSVIMVFGFITSVAICLALLCLRVLRNKDECKIRRDMGRFERGCCGFLRRTLDSSTGNLIRPGFHTFLKFQRRHPEIPPGVGNSSQGQI